MKPLTKEQKKLALQYINHGQIPKEKLEAYIADLARHYPPACERGGDTHG